MKLQKTRIKNNQNIIKIIIVLLIALLLGRFVYKAIFLYWPKDIVYNTNIQKILETIRPSTCSTSPLKLGDYVLSTPNDKVYIISTELTGYNNDQTIKPNELKLWRVVTTNHCNIELVSEYVSSNNIYFKGTTGYANYVGALNEISKHYSNKNVSKTRIMGYNGQTEYIKDQSSFNGISNKAPFDAFTPRPRLGLTKEYKRGVLGDTLYLKDYSLVQNVYQKDNNTENYCSTGVCAYRVGTTTKTDYWLASRHYSYQMPGYFTFDVRYINSNADLNLSNHNLRIYDGHYSGDWTECTYSSHAIRPIITLKKDLTISEGDGTKQNPYILK